MIAYNHYIKFVPEFDNEKKVEGSFDNIIMIMENTSFNFDKNFFAEATYNNNQGREVVLYTDRPFTHSVEGQIWILEVKEVITFFWHSGTLKLEYVKHRNFTKNLLEYWSLHIVLPIFFTLEGKYFFLHAGSVVVGNSAVLFLAESHGGKSTLTNFFINKQHMLISDDKVAIIESNNKFLAISSHPHHRPYREMEDLGFHVTNFANNPIPIQAIYVLESTGENDPIIISKVKGIKKFDTLYQHSEMNPVFQREERFEYLMKIARNVSVFTVKIPWSMKRLQEVYKNIIHHVESLEQR